MNDEVIGLQISQQTLRIGEVLEGVEVVDSVGQGLKETKAKNGRNECANAEPEMPEFGSTRPIEFIKSPMRLVRHSRSKRSLSSSTMRA